MIEVITTALNTIVIFFHQKSNQKFSKVLRVFDSAVKKDSVTCTLLHLPVINAKSKQKNLAQKSALINSFAPLQPPLP